MAKYAFAFFARPSIALRILVDDFRCVEPEAWTRIAVNLVVSAEPEPNSVRAEFLELCLTDYERHSNNVRHQRRRTIIAKERGRTVDRS